MPPENQRFFDVFRGYRKGRLVNPFKINILTMSDMSLVCRSSADLRRFFLFEILRKKLLSCPKSDVNWIGGGERDSSDVKTQISDVEKLVFCPVSCSF